MVWTPVTLSLRPSPRRSYEHTRVIRATAGCISLHAVELSPRPASSTTVGDPLPEQRTTRWRPSTVTGPLEITCRFDPPHPAANTTTATATTYRTRRSYCLGCRVPRAVLTMSQTQVAA